MATTTDAAIPQFPGVGSNPEASTSRIPVFKDGNPQQYMISIEDLGTAVGDTAPGLDSITQDVVYTDFTDGGSTVGTLVMTDAIPAGSIVLGSKVTVGAGFANDTSAVLTIGDGSDVDRYNTGTPSIFATAATGIETGVPSGSKLVLTANTPTLTVTTAADFTSVDAGEMTVTIYFIRTVAA